MSSIAEAKSSTAPNYSPAPPAGPGTGLSRPADLAADVAIGQRGAGWNRETSSPSRRGRAGLLRRSGADGASATASRRRSGPAGGRPERAAKFSPATGGPPAADRSTPRVRRERHGRRGDQAAVAVLRGGESRTRPVVHSPLDAGTGASGSRGASGKTRRRHRPGFSPAAGTRIARTMNGDVSTRRPRRRSSYDRTADTR